MGDTTSFGTSSAQQESFISNWQGQADVAGQDLGVDPDIILAQWAVESGWGTNTGATEDNNPGSLMDSGGTTLTKFSSPSAFVNAFVQTIQNTFSGAENSGSNVNQFVSGLTSGAGGESYTGVTNSGSTLASANQGYEVAIQDIANQLGDANASGGSTDTVSTGTAGSATSTDSAAGTGAGTSSTGTGSGTTTSTSTLPGVVSGWVSDIAPSILLILVAAGVIFIGISRSDAGTKIITATKNTAKAAFI